LPERISKKKKRVVSTNTKGGEKRGGIRVTEVGWGKEKRVRRKTEVGKKIILGGQAGPFLKLPVGGG